MKIIVVNGSPRKNWNTAQLLEKCIEGIRFEAPEAEVKLVHVYDYHFTGCRSCFGCKLLTNKPLECAVKDELHDLLIEMRDSDGFVIGSPMYFCDLSAQLKALLERLMYPGPSLKAIPSTFIYTMNAQEEQFAKMMDHQVQTTERFMENNFRSKPERVMAYDTFQRTHNELYRKGRTNMEAKEKRREVQFPIDCQKAFEAGITLVQRIQESKEKEI